MSHSDLMLIKYCTFNDLVPIMILYFFYFYTVYANTTYRNGHGKGGWNS